MPFYLLCDVSRAMTGNIAALSDGIARLRRTVVSQPIVDDVAWFCVISFSDAAKVLMPLGPMSDGEIPLFTVEGGTCYGAAFRTLAQVIDRDLTGLRQLGYLVHRPCAFFLAGSEPQDEDWHQAFVGALTYDRTTGEGMRKFPVFVPYGFWGAPEIALSRLAYPVGGQWYHAKRASLEEALDGLVQQIMLAAVLSRYGGAMSSSTLTPEIAPHGIKVARTSLGRLTPIAEGAFGKVFRVGGFTLAGDAAPLVYKEFTHDREVQASAAQAAVDFRAGLTSGEKAELDQISAWPRTLVEDEAGNACGLLMPLIPQEFFGQMYDPDTGHLTSKPREMTWTIAKRATIEAAQINLREISHEERLLLVAELARAISYLHERRWVFGDLSLKNVVFALDPPRIMLLECDQAAALDDLGRVQSSTPFWEPPEVATAPSPDQKGYHLQDTATDCYKLGLAILRCLTPGAGAAFTTSMDRLTGKLDSEGTDLVARALSPDRAARPPARVLHAYLAKAARRQTSPLPAHRPPEPAATALANPFAAPAHHKPDGPTPAAGGHVFISYAREDSALVDQLERALTGAGIPVWRDKASLWPGDEWEIAIRQAIETGALAFVYCFSRSGLTRPRYQNVELTLAIDQLRRRLPGQSWFFPIRFDDCDIPAIDIGGGRTLASFHRADLFGDACENETTRLIAAVLRVLRPR
jgi:hypothetical protein